jgi:hypothetical protein
LLFCGNEKLTTIGDSQMQLLSGPGSGNTRPFLQPGGEIRTAILYGHYPIEHPAARRLSRCKAAELSARVVSVGLYDSETGETVFDLSPLFHDAEATGLNTKIGRAKEAEAEVSARLANGSAQLQSSDALGVPELDARVFDVISRHAVRETRTDLHGHYRFDDVPPGTYLLFAHYKTAFDDSAWLVEVNAAKDVSQDLANFNMHDPRFSEDWKLVVQGSMR